MRDAGGLKDAVEPEQPPGPLVVRLDAGPASLSVLRHRVQDWLHALDWPADDLEDVVLAVNEAGANVIDHAYPPGERGEVWVDGRLADEVGLRRVVVEVRDQGRWRAAPADPGFRGHGFAVMRACLDRLEVRTTAGGTTLVMTSCPVQRLDPARARGRSALMGRAAPTTSVALDAGTTDRRQRHHLVARRAVRLRLAAAAAVDRARVVHAAAVTTAGTSARLIEQSRGLHGRRRPVAGEFSAGVRPAG